MYLYIFGNQRRYSSRLSIPMFIGTPCSRVEFIGTPCMYFIYYDLLRYPCNQEENEIALEICSIQHLNKEGRDKITLEFRSTFFPPRFQQRYVFFKKSKLIGIGMVYHGEKCYTKGLHFRACQEMCKRGVERDGFYTYYPPN